MDTILLAGFVLYPYLSVPSTLPLLVTNIDSTISHTIVIRNDGLETIHLQSIAVSNPAGFNLTTVALPHKLNYRDSLVVNVHFTPQSTDTVYATVTYASDSGVIASTRISGLGTKPLAVESPSPSSISCEIIPSVCEKNAMLNVRSSLMGKALISIRNMLGVTLCTTTAEFVNGYLTVPIQTGTFPNGPYFLTLTTQETVRTVKFIVRR